MTVDVSHRPDPPVVGVVTHHSIEFCWIETQKKYWAGEKGDTRPRFTIQEEDRIKGFGTVYTGYGTSYVIDGLDPNTKYRYRLQVHYGTPSVQSPWSAVITVATADLPMTTDHLHRAVARGDVHAVKKALEEGSVHIDCVDRLGYTALMTSAIHGMSEIATFLLEKGSRIDTQTSGGKDALMLAAYHGNLKVSKILHKNGASLTAKDRGGNTSLHLAVDGGSIEVIEWLIQKGANLESRDAVGQWTPLLRCAAVGGNVMVAKVLLENGCDINAVDKDGKSALMLATIKSNVSLAALLINNGINMNLKNLHGKTAYEMTEATETKQIARLISEKKKEEHELTLKKLNEVTFAPETKKEDLPHGEKTQNGEVVPSENGEQLSERQPQQIHSEMPPHTLPAE